MSLLTQDTPCYEEDGSFCRWVYERTDENESLAGAANWFVDKPLQILIILAIAWIATRLAKRAVGRLVTRIVNPPVTTSERLEKMGIAIGGFAGEVRDPRAQARATSLSAVLSSSAVVVIWVIAGLTILGTFDINLAPLLAASGVAGVALGFGAQTLVKDCIAGLFMLVEDQYGLGDVVDLGEASGVVEEISLRTTVLRGIDGTVWHVPNGVVERVGNSSQLWSVALVDVDVAYDTDLTAARELLHRAAIEVCDRDGLRDHIIEPPTVLGVEALAADGITLRLTVKVQPGSQWELQRALREHIKAVFDGSSVEIPFPQRTVWMRNEPDATS